jgi:hypothetical protein
MRRVISIGEVVKELSSLNQKELVVKVSRNDKNTKLYKFDVVLSFFILGFFLYEITTSVGSYEAGSVTWFEAGWFVVWALVIISSFNTVKEFVIDKYEKRLIEKEES